MAGAGIYGDRLQRLVRTVTKNPQTGQDEETFTPAEWLWATVESLTGRRQRDYGADQTGADAVIRVRNWPTLSALDRLSRPVWGETYVIDTIAYGDNETVCTCIKYDDLTL